MDLETYLDRYGFNASDFTRSYLKRVRLFTTMQRTEVLVALGALEEEGAREFSPTPSSSPNSLDSLPTLWAEAQARTAAQQKVAAANMSPDKQVAMNLMAEAEENLRLAKVLRDTAFHPDDGSIMSSIGDASKTLLAIDKLIDSASKRFQVIYNQATQAAMEDAVKEILRDMEQDTYEQFISLLEERLSGIQ